MYILYFLPQDIVIMRTSVWSGVGFNPTLKNAIQFVRDFYRATLDEEIVVLHHAMVVYNY